MLAIALFFALGLFPGGGLVLAVAIGYLFGVIFAFAVSTVSSAMPRSGGDYILVGRTIHPMVGLHLVVLLRWACCSRSQGSR